MFESKHKLHVASTMHISATNDLFRVLHYDGPRDGSAYERVLFNACRNEEPPQRTVTKVEYVVESLLDDGADVSAVTGFWKKTVFMTEHLSPEVAQLLLSRGAGCVLRHVSDDMEKTCLAFVKNPRTMKILMDAGAEVSNDVFYMHLAHQPFKVTPDGIRLFFERGAIIPNAAFFRNFAMCMNSLIGGEMRLAGIRDVFEERGFIWPEERIVLW